MNHNTRHHKVLKIAQLTRVVSLAKAAKETGSRGGVDDAAILLLSEVGPSGLGALVGALDVDLDDKVPVRILDVLEADIAEDTGVVDEHIDAAESLDGGLNNALAVLDGVIVGNGLAASSLDLVDYNIGGLKKRVHSESAFRNLHC